MVITAEQPGHSISLPATINTSLVSPYKAATLQTSLWTLLEGIHSSSFSPCPVLGAEDLFPHLHQLLAIFCASCYGALMNEIAIDIEPPDDILPEAASWVLAGS